MIQMLISPRNTLKDTPQLALKAGIKCASEIPLLSLSSACPLPEEEIHTEWSSRDISPRSVILGLWPDSSDSEVRSIIFIDQITQFSWNCLRLQRPFLQPDICLLHHIFSP